MSGFTHLHVHTEYSLLDGAARVKDIIAKAKELNMNSLAITDHGVMYGAVEFFKEAKDNGIKPIIGCEVYVAPKSRFDKTAGAKDYNHLILLAKNETGYKNLTKLVSLGYLEGFYYKPRIDFELLKKYSEGLVCLSACLAGAIPQALIQNNYSKAQNIAERYKELFGDDFYIEIQDHGIREQKEINPYLLKLAKELNIKLAATNDVHYVNKDNSFAQEVLMCIQTSNIIDSDRRMNFGSEEFYLKSEEEMRAIFSHIPEAIDNTSEIADKCSYEFDFKQSHLPFFETPENQNHAKYLESIAKAGLTKRYPNLTPEIEERFNYELETIKNMGFTDYFLIVWDFVRFAKENKIAVGPGRGSAAGSIVAYCLEITNIDPLKYNLLFERFLNPERISMPDIDIDFCYERRGEVIDYVTRKYGAGHVSQIITFGTLGAKQAIRDVGRVLGATATECDRIAKMVPFSLNMTIDRALKENPALLKDFQTNEMTAQIINIAKTIEGMPRHASTHAAGVVISNDPITESVPLQKNTKDESVMTQFPMKQLEKLGLLKMDFLGLRTLTVIRDTVDMIRENTGIELDPDTFNYNDKDVYEMISAGDTEGVFQLESGGMRNLMQQLKPANLDEIMVGISLFRPGPMESIPEYIRCKKNPDKVNYDHPLLKPILQDTYGCMVYQEQIMRIVRDVAGYSMARSDLVRRAMSKKQHDVLEKERKLFIFGDAEQNVDGAVKRGVPESVAEDLFDQMMAFANYAFNKSHACAYAVVAYQTAYLKRHYPVEFLTALMNSFIGSKDKINGYIGSLKAQNIKLLPPDINKSKLKFTAENGAIRFGLNAIANVGETIDAVIERRGDGYNDFSDFILRNIDILNKKSMESLILSGTLDTFGYKRSALYHTYEQFIMEAQKTKTIQSVGQISLFDINGEDFDTVKPQIPDCEEFPKAKLLAFEKEKTGLYISGHPMDDYAEILRERSDTISSLKAVAEDESAYMSIDGKFVTVAGIITKVTKRTLKDKSVMAVIEVEDLGAQITVVVYSSIYENIADKLKVDAIIDVTGKVTVDENRTAEIKAKSIRFYAKDDETLKGKQLYVKIKGKRDIEALRRAASDYPGVNSIALYFADKNQYKRHKGRVSYCQGLKKRLEDELGKEAVVFK